MFYFGINRFSSEQEKASLRRCFFCLSVGLSHRGSHKERDANIVYLQEIYEEKYNRTKTSDLTIARFKNLIQGLHKDTGLKTVVVLDEYDSPLLDYLHQPEQLPEVRAGN